MRIAVSNPDNIGDLVLRQPMISALSDAGHEVLIIVRDFVAPLAADMFPQAIILQCTGNPYERDFSLQSHLGQAFQKRVVEFDPQIFVVASYQHTMMEEILASALPTADCVGFTGHLFQARPEITVLSTIRFATRVSVVEDSSELEKNAHLCSAVLGSTVALNSPWMEAHPDGIETAKVRLEKLGIMEQRFWAVCAGDIADKSVKNWHREQWAEFCGSLVETHGIPLLFIGSTDEHEATAAIEKLMGEAGLRTAAITNEPTKLRTLTGILHLAEGYIGKDTGPMHIAAALGKPVLSVFGGGHWPRFVPAAKTGAAFTVNVPCQGCNWTCHLERSHCVKDIPVATVLQAAGAMLDGRSKDFRVEVLQPGEILESAILRELWAAARREHQKVAAERSNFMQWHDDRMRDIAQLRAQLEATAGERDGMAKAATEAAPLRSALQEIEQRLAQRETERNGLAAELEARKLRQEELQVLVDRAASLEERAATLEFESRLLHSNLRQATEDRAAAERKLERFRHAALRKIAESRARSESLRTELAGLRANLEVGGEAALEREEWRAKWVAAAAESETLRRRLEEAAVRVSELQLQVDTSDSRYQGQIADLEQVLKRRANELASALALIPDLRDELGSLSAELGQSEGKLAATTQLYELAQGTLERTQEELHVTLEDHAARLVVIETLSEGMAELDRDRAAKQELIEGLEASLAVSEADRDKRLEVIHSLSGQLTLLEGVAAERQTVIEALNAKLESAQADRMERIKWTEELSRRLADSERDREARLRLIEDVSAKLAESERDREARLQLIGDISAKLADSERDREARLRLIEDVSAKLDESERDRDDRLRLIEDVSAKLAESEKDRDDRLELIGDISAKLAESERDRDARLRLIEDISAKLAESERDRDARLQLIEDISAKLAESEKDRDDRLQLIEDISAKLAESERDRDARLQLIEDISAKLDESEKDRDDRLQLIEDVSAKLAESEKDRDQRLRLIEDVSERLAECERDRAQRLQLIEEVSARLEASEADRDDRLRLIERLSDTLAAIETDRENRGTQITALHAHAHSLEAEIAALRNLLPYRILKQLHIV